MKQFYTLTSLLAICFLSSFTPNKACNYAGSNLGFVKTQTEKAISENTLSQLRYFTYKALNAIEKSKGDLDNCGCKDAAILISDGKENLKEAVRTPNLSEAKALLRASLQNTTESMEALENHEFHENKYPDDVLAMNTNGSESLKIDKKNPAVISLHQRIDNSLIDYEISLNEIVLSVDCNEAHAYVTRVIDQCEAELLKPYLSEGKKYYNLRTKEITIAAKEQLGNCN